MGLAASQARMLLLTARKSDVEGQMMSISNQKLAMSRQAADLSKKYSDALNATKFEWNTGSGKKDLSYDLFMNPANAVTGSGQYLLRNANTNAIILSDTTLSKFGLSASGGAGSITSVYPTQADFVAAAMGITSPSGKAQVATDVAAIGTSSTDIISKTDANKITGFKTSYTDAYVRAELASGTYKYNCIADSGGAVEQRSYSGNDAACATKFVFDIDDPIKQEANLHSLVSDITSDVAKATTAVLKTKYGAKWTDELQTLIATAEVQAQTYTDTYYYQQLKHMQSITGNSGNDRAKAAIEGTTGIADATHNQQEIWLDSNQIINVFLNYFDAQCAKLNGDDATQNAFGARNPSTSLPPSAAERTVQGTSTDGKCTVTTVDDPTGDDTTGSADSLNSNGVSDTYEEKYYMNLYNALKSYGWETNSGIKSEEGLQSQMMYGNVSILQLTSGGWTSLSTSDIASPLTTESDTEAVSKAEAEYNSAKDELDYKESQLDITMNNLDTERSAIDTEVDSVQKIINKNIEKSFKMFEA